jgi:hypothetical protein
MGPGMGKFSQFYVITEEQETLLKQKSEFLLAASLADKFNDLSAWKIIKF